MNSHSFNRQEITCVSLDVTTVCDRACKDCCCGINMGLRPAKHHPWEYFVNAAKFLYGIERIHLTGGEPTTSPIFERLANGAKELFGCKTLTLQTDGFKAIQYEKALRNFDHIYYSRYDERNELSSNFLKDQFTSTEWNGDFISRSKRGSGKVCGRGESEGIAYADGKLWPCCVAPGIPEAEGIEPTQNWKEDIKNVNLACEHCWFSPD